MARKHHTAEGRLFDQRHGSSILFYFPSVCLRCSMGGHLRGAGGHAKTITVCVESFVPLGQF